MLSEDPVPGSEEILFAARGPLGVVTLNRPRVLNALTLEMFRAHQAQLSAWERDPAIKAVLIAGAGERAFCAGGDIRALYDSMLSGGDLAAELYRVEYRLNRHIYRYSKPYIAWLDGIVMGGGVGLSVHGSHRVASERTVFAMPETGIGLYPDVGATYFLPRLPGQVGLYLGLTGARLGAADCLGTGLATHCIAGARFPEVAAALAEADWSGDAAATVDAVLGRFAAAAGEPLLAARRGAIDRCFAGDSVEAIVAALEADGSEWAEETLATLGGRSPTSLKVAFKALRDGAHLTFEQAMTVEYRLSLACVAGHDFREGIRAVVIDKDQRPRWTPPTLERVDAALVERHFRPLGARDLVFK